MLLATSLSYPVHSSTILLREEPFTPEQIDAVSKLASRNPKMQMRHPAQDPEDRRSIPNAVITAPQHVLESLYESYSFDVTPSRPALSIRASRPPPARCRRDPP